LVKPRALFIKHELFKIRNLHGAHELVLNDNTLIFNYMLAVHRMVFVTKIEPEVRFPSPEMYRMLSVYFSGCDTNINGIQFYTSEEGDALLWLMYTQVRHVYTYETVYLKPIQYLDAPPNPPVMSSETYGTVTINVAVLEGVARVYFEPKPYPNAGFKINYLDTLVQHAFMEIIVETQRLANWEDTRRPKPNPASMVV